MANLFSVIDVARLEGCCRGSRGEIGFLILAVLLAEGNTEQHSEVTWPGLIQGACKATDDSCRHLFKFITNPLSETAFGVLSGASGYLLKRQMQYELSDRSLCHLPLPPTLQILLLIVMQQHPSHLLTYCLMIYLI